MIRHIVVEGPDGAGKTTLIDRIVRELGFTRHRRASHSTDGPVDDLDQWVVEDLNKLARHAPSVFDRHPLISEPIYGPICRNGVPGLFNQKWWVDAMRARLACHAIVIICLPPFEVVNKYASKVDQMPGVMANLSHIYSAYQYMVWPGMQMRYNRVTTDWSTMVPVLRQVVSNGR